MKGLNKIALVTAISAASFGVNAELKSLDDSTMSNLTGQSGITIELQTKVDIGQIVYTDTDDGGSLVMNQIAVGGMGNSYGAAVGAGGVALDDIQVDIDLMADGDAVISVHNKNGLAPLDFGLDMASAMLAGTEGTTTLLSGLNMDGAITDYIQIRVDTATDVLSVGTGFVVADLDATFDFLAVGIEDAMIGAADTDWTAVATAGAAGDVPGVVGALAGGNNGKGVTGKGARVDLTVAADANANAGGKALQIKLDTFSADMNIAKVYVGTDAAGNGLNIGSVFINDLVISDTVMEVYGH